jgi:amidase
MAYLPSTVIPVGRTRSGLPVGMQVVGPFLEDRTCLTAARLLADVLGPWEAPPLAL